MLIYAHIGLTSPVAANQVLCRHWKKRVWRSNLRVVDGSSRIYKDMPPRRIWDLYANRVIQSWVTPKEPRGISHAWVDEKDRVGVMTPINGNRWPVPMPKDADLDLIRIEMLNLEWSTRGWMCFVWGRRVGRTSTGARQSGGSTCPQLGLSMMGTAGWYATSAGWVGLWFSKKATLRATGVGLTERGRCRKSLTRETGEPKRSFAGRPVTRAERTKKYEPDLTSNSHLCDRCETRSQSSLSYRRCRDGSQRTLWIKSQAWHTSSVCDGSQYTIWRSLQSKPGGTLWLRCTPLLKWICSSITLSLEMEGGVGDHRGSRWWHRHFRGFVKLRR